MLISLWLGIKRFFSGENIWILLYLNLCLHLRSFPLRRFLAVQLLRNNTDMSKTLGKYCQNPVQRPFIYWWECDITYFSATAPALGINIKKNKFARLIVQTHLMLVCISIMTSKIEDLYILISNQFGFLFCKLVPECFVHLPNDHCVQRRTQKPLTHGNHRCINSQLWAGWWIPPPPRRAPVRGLRSLCL